MASSRWPLAALVVLALLLVANGPVATGTHEASGPAVTGGANDDAAVTYAGGGGASGVVLSTCDATFAHIALDVPTTLTADGGAWSLTEARYERVVVDQTTRAPESPARRGDGAATGPLGPGPIHLKVAREGGIWALPLQWDTNPDARFAATGTDAHSDWTPYVAKRPLQTFYDPNPTQLASDVVPTLRSPSFAAPTRVLSGSNGDTTLSGDLAILVRHADVMTPEGELRVPPPERYEYTAVQQTRIVSEAWLFVRNVEWTLPSSALSTHCSGMRHGIDGDLSWQGATGTYTLAGQTRTVANELLTLRGTMNVIDNPANTAGFGKAHSAGDFQLAAVDHTVSAAAPIAGQIVLITALGALGAILARGTATGWIAALYSRIERDSVLDHPVRALLMDHVEANPGTNVHATAHELAISRSVARHHVTVMVNAGVIRRLRIGGEILLVTADQDADPRLAVVEVKPQARFLAEATRRAPVLRKELIVKLEAEFKMTQSGARKWITRCESFGILLAEGHGHGVRYRCALPA